MRNLIKTTRLAIACSFLHASIVSAQPLPLAMSTMQACQNLADRAKILATDKITISEGPFEEIFRLKLREVCSFTTVVKPSMVTGSEKLLGPEWTVLNHYATSGSAGYARAWKKDGTACFVSEQWDDLGDKATQEQQSWIPKPGTLRIACTDLTILDDAEKEIDEQALLTEDLDPTSAK
jgi:hypothetical protein